MQFRKLQREGRPVKTADLSRMDTAKCLNCGTEFHGRYCPVCGQASDTRRLDVKGLLTGLFTALVGGDSTFARTATDLLYRPGYLVRDYICGKRAGYYKPVPLLLFLVTLFVLLSMAIDSSYSPFGTLSGVSLQDNIHSDSLTSAVLYLSGLLSNKVTFALLLSFVFVMPFDMIFRGRSVQRPDGSCDRLKVAEHFYALVYISCLYIILSFVMLAFSGIESAAATLNALSLLLPVFLAAWTYRQIYEISWLRSIVYTAAAITITAAMMAIVTILVFGLFYGYDAASA